MTRKHFQAIADVFANKNNPDAANLGFASCRAEEMRKELARAMADTLASENPRFDRAKFLAACKASE